MYEQTLYKVIEPIKINTLKRLNRSKKWKYGYNKENDVVVISRNGQIGEVYDIQGLKIALPPTPKSVYSNDKDRWQRIEPPKALSKLKNIFDWREYCLLYTSPSPRD